MKTPPNCSPDLEVYDTTLRDGTQGYGIDLSVEDKLALTAQLDDLGVAFIEGGWPGSNPKDEAYFREVAKQKRKVSRISAFGSTRRRGLAPENDPNLAALVASSADVCCIFGKSWDLHIREALRVSEQENLAMISESVAFLKRATGRPVFYDAEHFFDGFRDNAECALSTLKAAFEAGAERLILCDTNGGSLPGQITQTIAAVRKAIPSARWGIHVHNDGGLATANTLAAIEAGCVQVHGTINGVGERCGNVDLTQVIANCELKLGRRCLPEGGLRRLTQISAAVWERLNRVGPDNQPYVGLSAFAHKGGVHVSAMQRNERTYEHVPPNVVGNERRILISDMAGRSSLLAKLEQRYPQLSDASLSAPILDEVQRLEHQGYSFEAADGSLELLVRRHLGNVEPAFQLEHYRMYGIGMSSGDDSGSEAEAEHGVEATVKLRVGDRVKLCAAEGNGPISALSEAMRAALTDELPWLGELRLTDYKVRVVNSQCGAGARVRVLIEHELRGERFSTVGVHTNIIRASWQALADAVDYGQILAGR